jgi:hypothetical protein
MNAAFMPYEQAGRARGRAGSRSREPAGTHQYQKPRNRETPEAWLPPICRRPGPSGVLNTTDVREWARAQGIEVKDRGRVPADLVAKFKAANGQQG